MRPSWPTPSGSSPTDVPAGVVASTSSATTSRDGTATVQTSSTRAAASVTATAYLAEVAASVVGVDVSEDAIAYARGALRGRACVVRAMDVTALEFATTHSTSSARSRRSSTARVRALRCARPRAFCARAASTSSRRRTSSGRARLPATLPRDGVLAGRLRVGSASVRERRALRSAAAGDAPSSHAPAAGRARLAAQVRDPSPRLRAHRLAADDGGHADDIVIERDAFDGATEVVAVCR